MLGYSAVMSLAKRLRDHPMVTGYEAPIEGPGDPTAIWQLEMHLEFHIRNA